jgi:hypothetical protein
MACSERWWTKVCLPPWEVVAYQLCRWRKSGPWQRIHDALYTKACKQAGKKHRPTAGIPDSRASNRPRRVASWERLLTFPPPSAVNPPFAVGAGPRAGRTGYPPPARLPGAAASPPLPPGRPPHSVSFLSGAGVVISANGTSARWRLGHLRHRQWPAPASRASRPPDQPPRPALPTEALRRD